MKLYTIRDGSAEFFLPPFCAPNANVAQRMFIGSLGDSFNFRADFLLYCIGEFDDQTGLLKPSDPTMVLAGSSIAQSLDPRVQQEEHAQ